jgi:hypothetical protein
VNSAGGGADAVGKSENWRNHDACQHSEGIQWLNNSAN